MKFGVKFVITDVFAGLTRTTALGAVRSTRTLHVADTFVLFTLSLDHTLQDHKASERPGAAVQFVLTAFAVVYSLCTVVNPFDDSSTR